MVPPRGISDLTGLVEYIPRQRLGNGALSDVYKGNYSGNAVAIKVFRIKEVEKYERRFAREINVWVTLTQKPHKNIVDFLGTMRWNGQWALVSLYVDHGPVIEYIKSNPQVNRQQLVLDIVSGLQHMHRLDIVHGDLKPVNVLVNKDNVAQITDFGQSRLLDDETYATLTRHRCSTAYIPPESIIVMTMAPNFDPYILVTKPADIYAMSITAYEVLKGDYYHIGGSQGAPYARVVEKKRRPEEHESISNPWYAILARCWEADPTKRPGIEEVVQDVKNLIK